MRARTPTAFLLFSSSLLSLTAAAAAKPSRGGGQPIIIDTDLFGDVDDVGALTIANVLHNCGLADIKGIAINTHSKYGAPAASVCGLHDPFFTLTAQNTKR